MSTFYFYPHSNFPLVWFQGKSVLLQCLIILFSPVADYFHSLPATWLKFVSLAWESKGMVAEIGTPNSFVRWDSTVSCQRGGLWKGDRRIAPVPLVQMIAHHQLCQVLCPLWEQSASNINFRNWNDAIRKMSSGSFKIKSFFTHLFAWISFSQNS